jgi:hypothetical protein
MYDHINRGVEGGRNKLESDATRRIGFHLLPQGIKARGRYLDFQGEIGFQREGSLGVGDSRENPGAAVDAPDLKRGARNGPAPGVNDSKRDLRRGSS